MSSEASEIVGKRLDDPEGFLRETEERLAGLKAKSDELQAQLTAVATTATNPDKTVSVTVGPNGGLTGLVLRPSAMDMGAEKLTATILGLVRQAQRKSSEQVRALFMPLADGSESMRLYEDSMPEPETTEPEFEDRFAIEDDEPEEKATPSPRSKLTATRSARKPKVKASVKDDVADEGLDEEARPW